MSSQTYNLTSTVEIFHQKVYTICKSKSLQIALQYCDSKLSYTTSSLQYAILVMQWPQAIVAYRFSHLTFHFNKNIYKALLH